MKTTGWILLAVLLLLPTQAAGQCLDGRCPVPRLVVPRAPQVSADVQSKQNNIVRIEVQEGNGHSWGSGTIVQQRGKCAWVLTVSHLLRDRKGQVIVHVTGRGRWYARVVAEDPLWDLALLLIGNPGVEPARIAKEIPTHGERLKLGGFGPAGRFGWSHGLLRGFAAPGPSQRHDLLQVAGTVRQGNSGGPMATADGRIVGVITGTDGRVTVGASVVQIRQLLASIAPKPPQKPDDPFPLSQGRLLAAIAENTRIIAELRKELATIEARPGLAGPRGPSGAQGAPGADGLPGKGAATVDVDVLLVELQSRWPLLRVEIMGADDTPAMVQEVGVGGTIRIPPVVVSKIEDGKIYWQVKPLGEAIRLELVPID